MSTYLDVLSASFSFAEGEVQRNIDEPKDDGVEDPRDQYG